MYVVLMSFFVSAVCGYMAGLIGSSNSPLSGIGILVVIGAALLLVIGVKPYVSPDSGKPLMAFALFTTAVIFNVAAIANNNLQDLKTGQLVDATPWKQQFALVIGVVAGAFVIPPVLDLVNHAYGFVGAPGAEARPNHLPAPQAGLISSLSKGVIAADIDWSLIRIGGLIGVGIILLDEILARTTKHMRVPPLAVSSSEPAGWSLNETSALRRFMLNSSFASGFSCYLYSHLLRYDCPYWQPQLH